MAKKQVEYERTSMGNEGKNASNNNLYQKDFERTVSNDNYADGMGIARPNALKSFEDIPGLEQADQVLLKNREIKRFDELERKAFGNPVITNAGIVLDEFGGALGEGRRSPKDTRGTGKEQVED